jgi:hypothetical protein
MLVADDEMTVEGLGTGVAPASARRRRGVRAGAALNWVRERLATTPGRLVLISISVVVGAVVFGAIATGAEQSRERAARSAATQTEPLLAHAARLYTALSDANATEGTALLTGGVESPTLRLRYQSDLAAASDSLSVLTREAGTSATVTGALNTIGNELPIYSGLVETARANNRQGFPIGAAYLRQAVAQSTGIMLPAADLIYRAEAQRLAEDYNTGSSTATLVTFIVVSAVALILLLLAQRYVARASRRILNIGMLVATVAVAAVSVWGVVGLLNEQNSLATAKENGSDSVEVLSAATVMQSRAQSDLSLTVVNRGADASDSTDFNSVQPVLGGLVAEISALARGTGTTAAADRLDSNYASYRATARRITNDERAGRLTGPTGELALEPTAASVSDQVSTDLTQQIGAAQDRFVRAATDATSALDGLSVAIPVITVLAAVASLLGLRQRINEYR